MIRYICIQNIYNKKNIHIYQKSERIAEVNKIPIDEIFHSSNEEIIPINEMEDRKQKVVIFDDYVCEKNQNDIIFYIFYTRET